MRPVRGTCDHNFKRGWICTRDWNHGGPCALWPTRLTRIKYWLRGRRLP